MTDDADAARLWLGHSKPRLKLNPLPPPEPKPRKKPKSYSMSDPRLPDGGLRPAAKKSHQDSVKKWVERRQQLSLLYHQGPPPKTKFELDMIPRARQMCEWGLTDHQIAVAFGVNVYTLIQWQATFPGFAEAFIIGDEISSSKVERALYARAVGYEYDAEKILVVDKQVVRVPYKEHVPPDISAGKFWLLNRRKSKWRDLQQHEIGRVGEFDEMTPDELREFIEREAKEISAGVSTPEALGGEGSSGNEPE